MVNQSFWYMVYMDLLHVFLMMNDVFTIVSNKKSFDWCAAFFTLPQSITRTTNMDDDGESIIFISELFWLFARRFDDDGCFPKLASFFQRILVFADAFCNLSSEDVFTNFANQNHIRFTRRFFHTPTIHRLDDQYGSWWQVNRFDI